MRSTFVIVRLALAGCLVSVIPRLAGAQGDKGKPAHTLICASGVRVYNDKADIKVPYDTVALPPGPQVRVTSQEEAEAAQLAMRERAGSVGANGLLMTDETEDDGTGNVRVRRSVQGIFVPSDSARAIAVCKKS